MNIKAIMKYHFIPMEMVDMAVIKKIITSTGKDVDKFRLSYTASGNVKWYGRFGKQAVPQKVNHIVNI